MKIETKFNINDLVISKYNKNKMPKAPHVNHAMLCCFEVIEIHTVTCMAGTQQFYDVRTIYGEMEIETVDNKRVTKFVDFNIGAAPHNREYSRMREDELVKIPQELAKTVLG